MKSFVTNVVVDGEIVTPHPINDEFLDIAGTANRLDDENIALTSLASSKLAVGAMHRLLWDPIETARSYTFTTLIIGTSVIPILNAGGSPWVQSITTRGGLLYLTLRVAIEGSIPALGSSALLYAWAGIRVDGEIVARSGDQEGQAPTDTLIVRRHLPLGAGTHVIEPVLCVNNPGNTGFAGNQVDYYDRALAVMEALQ